MTGSLEASDKRAEAVATHPRVTLDDIKASIQSVHYLNGSAVLGDGPYEEGEETALAVLTLCVVLMHNGFTVVGKSAPASPENFDQELGEELAYEDAVRQIWPLMGFALRERLSER